MSIQTVKAFFLWCTVLNGGLLILSSLVLMCAGDLVFRLHGRWFRTSRETFNAIIYGFLGFYKVIVISFNLVPYVALAILQAGS